MFEILESRQLLSASVSNGILTITGSDHAERINVVQRGAAVIVHEGTSVTRFAKKQHVSSIVINALGGNDRIKVTSKLNATIDGGDGKDQITGGAGSDVLLGGNGNDRILGQAGNDSVSGGAGRDVLFGGAGDDVIDAFDTEADQIAGGAGSDSARVDTQTDTAWNIEDYLSVTTNSSGSVTDISNSSVVNVNAGKLIYTGANAGTGSVNVAGSSAGTLSAGSLTLNGVASNATGIDQIALDSAANTFTLSGNSSINLFDLGSSGSGDFVLIDYNNSTPLSGSLNISGVTGFTTGTYRLFTMTQLANTGDIVLVSSNGSGAFNYAIVEPTPTNPIEAQPAAADPVVVIGDEDPPAAQLE
jgi:hypothetical protein